MSFLNTVVAVIVAALVGYRLYIVANRPVPEDLENPIVIKLLDELGRLGNFWIVTSEVMGIPANIWPVNRISDLVFNFIVNYGREHIRMVKVSSDIIEGLPVKIYSPCKNGQAPDKELLPTIIYYHGGGWAWFSLDTYEGFLKYLANATKFQVISVGYRQAKERNFPAFHEDCFTVSDSILRHYEKYQVNPKKVLVAGDGAGGNLAASIAQRMRDRILMQILIYPALQVLDFKLPSFQDNADILPGITSPFREITHWLWYGNIPVSYRSAIQDNYHSSSRLKQSKFAKYLDTRLHLPKYLNVTKRKNVPSVVTDYDAVKAMSRHIVDTRFVPMMEHSLDNVPNAYVITAQYDVLRDEGIMYAKRLHDSYVKVKLMHYREGFHGFLLFAGNKLFNFPVSGRAMSSLVSFLDTKVLDKHGEMVLENGQTPM